MSRLSLSPCLFNLYAEYRASQEALVIKNLPADAGDMRRGFDHWVGKIPWKLTRLKQLITHTGTCVEYISWNARRRELQAGIKTARRNINNLSYADDTILMAESGEELKNLLMRVKEESENTALKLNIQKTKIMASGTSLYGK